MAENKKPTIIKAYCASCRNSTNHKILHKEERMYGDWEQGEDRWIVEWQIIECQGCDTISGRELKTFEGEYDPETGEHYEQETLYPKRGENLLQVKNFLNLPVNLRQIYRETIDTFNNQNPILCSSGIRAVIEGVCTECKIENGPIEVKKGETIEIVRRDNLEGKINGLHEKGILTKRHADILHKHRSMGNKGVHLLREHSNDDLQAAIEIIEHTFESLWEIGPKAKRIGNPPKFGISPSFD